ncbi:hypothetical protein OUY22_07715 [Nonomuraea sp. MCN248]|uniref:YbjN domain-containing protein n=1 Tax=Nonomuraea corallina TaxID=2989783 RepID=A0ABT4S816_9ACTN|nr:hypothetical protein [Nonomuraea corallina]MDA0633304.1 hypothetical protein [Nonomuraea corallina]
MNLDYLIKRGLPPWRPRPEASDLDVWHEYEIPLTGTFHLNGDLILFTQVAAATEERSAWAYVCIDPVDADSVENAVFASLDEMDAFVEDRFAGREVVIALADSDELIGLWTREIINSGGLPQALESALNTVIKSVNSVDGQERRIRVKLAGVEAAKAELDVLSA